MKYIITESAFSGVWLAAAIVMTVTGHTEAANVIAWIFAGALSFVTVATSMACALDDEE